MTVREEAKNNFFVSNFVAEMEKFKEILKEAYADGYINGYSAGLEYADKLLEEAKTE